MSKDVSVIIVNYRTGKLVCDSIRSIFAESKDLSYEIIVVDNNSGDESASLIRNEFKDKVTLIEAKSNGGFGAGNNEGIKYATGRHLFFLNPDTLIRNNCLKILSDYLDKNEASGVAGGNIIDRQGKPAWSFRRFLPSLFWEVNDLLFTLPEKIIFGNNISYNHTGKPLQVGYITGAGMMIPRRILDISGLFDPSFFLYFEECDLERRIRRLGFDIVSVPEAIITHTEGESFNSKAERTKHYINGKHIYYTKNLGSLMRLIVISVQWLTIATRLLIFGVSCRRSRFRMWRDQADFHYKAMRRRENYL